MSDNSISSVIDLSIVSAHGEIWSGQVRMVSAVSVEGDLGILPRHTPLLTRLQPGEVRIRTAGDEDEYIYVSGGIMEVQPFMITILADTALRSDEIDEQAAREAKARAESIIATSVLYSDRDRAQAELLKAMAQLATLEDARRKRRKR